MASRRFFPYGNQYYYPSCYRTAPACDDGAFFFPGVERVQPAVRSCPYDAFFPGVESVQPAVHPSPFAYCHQPSPAGAPEESHFFPAVQVREPSARVIEPKSSRSRSVSVPVHFAGSESELAPERAAARLPVLAADMMAHAAVNKKQDLSVAAAAVRMQAAARGFMVRRMVREVRAVEREAEGVATRLAVQAEALRGDARARVAIGEELMRLLLRLDAVRGVREYRRRVTKRVLALQDAVDALERPPAPAAATDTPVADEALEAEIVEMAEGKQVTEERKMASELLDADEQDLDVAAEIETELPAVTQMEVDEGGATGDETGDRDLTTLVERAEKEQEVEGEWEMVTEEDAAARENPAPEAQQQAPPAEEEEEKKKTQVGEHAADSMDTKKVLEMVAALCEQSAQQCVVIGALAERVDMLERAVRRVEEANRRRRRNKKPKEAKGSNKAAQSCYSD